MKRPRGYGLSRKLTDVLADAPRAMLLGELEAALDFEYQPAEIMSVLVKLRRAGKVVAKLRERDGPGPKKAQAYSLVSAVLGF